MPRLGIFGRANVGKTTLFNALTGLDAPTAPHPYSTTELNLGVARIPDERLTAAAAFEGSDKVTPATLELVDVPMSPGAAGGLPAEALGRLREMEALVAVVRSFADDGVPSDESGLDPVAQTEELILEMALADGEVLERRGERAAKEATADSSRQPAAEAIALAAARAGDGIPLRAHEWSDAERDAMRDLAPLSLKPTVWVVNVSEEDHDPAVAEQMAAVVPAGDTIAVLSAKLEEEAAHLDPEDRVELFEGLGLGEGALVKVVAAAYEAMGLITFFTLGPKEARAWSVRRGSTVRAAAGKVHSDLERGFIRADVAPIGTVVEHGGWAAAKKAGVVRLEGKEYIVEPDDVIEVRFSV